MREKGFIAPLLLVVLILVVSVSAYLIVKNSNEVPTSTQPSVVIGTPVQQTSVLPIPSSYCQQTDVPLPSLAPEAINNLKKGQPKIELAYASKTNLSDPIIKANTDADTVFVKKTINPLPIVGSPLISLSSQNRYGYNFPAVNRESTATYNRDISQLFINMDQVSEHAILHEMAHYLSIIQDRKNLEGYMPADYMEAAGKAEGLLLNCIRKYDKAPNMQAIDVLDKKFKSNQQVTWNEIVDASNVYSAQIYQNPQSFLQFKGTNPLPEQVKKRADDELYAEFSAYLLEAQEKNLFDTNYQHPVYKILAIFR